MSEINDHDFSFIRELVYRESAISIESDMKYLVESRLNSLVRRTEHECIGNVVQILRQGRNDSLERQVVDAMTTNETSFFRDSHPFRTLCEEVLPTIAASHNDTIELWCAACSTGQEAYTIAMAIHEYCPELIPRLSIVATDISSEVISKAQSGLYNRLEVNRGLPVQLLTKYFVQQGLSWKVSKELQDMVRFEEMNLIKSWSSIKQMDIVFLRNVLIYFDPEVKTRILKSVCEHLKPDGYLFLGLSETTLNLKTDFTRITTDLSHYYKVA